MIYDNQIYLNRMSNCIVLLSITGDMGLHFMSEKAGIIIQNGTMDT